MEREPSESHQGMARTIGYLKHSPHRAAGLLLVEALDTGQEEIQALAVEAILHSTHGDSQRALLDRWLQLPAELRRESGRGSRALLHLLRADLVGNDTQRFERACQVAEELEEYELAPVLVAVAEDPRHWGNRLAASVVLRLAERLRTACRRTTDLTRRDPTRLRTFLAERLGRSAKQFGDHKQEDLVEAYLLLASTAEAPLREMLAQPSHPAHRVLTHLLAQSPRAEIQRLLLDLCFCPDVPQSVIQALAERAQLPFVAELGRRCARAPEGTLRSVARQLERMAWVEKLPDLLGELDGEAQAGLVRLVKESALPSGARFQVIAQVLQRGKEQGRRVAAEALAPFGGHQANQLALQALDDPDPQVQRAIIRQVRQRGIPGVIARLLELLDSTDAGVRQAVREALQEFTVQQFLASMDSMEPEARRSTAQLVRKVDEQAADHLRRELAHPSRVRRMRAVQATELMELVDELEEEVRGLLQDDDHFVRVAAARALQQARSTDSLQALRQALLDVSPAVREQASQSLAVRTGQALPLPGGVFPHPASPM